MITGLWYTKLWPVARYFSHTRRVLAAKSGEVASMFRQEHIFDETYRGFRPNAHKLIQEKAIRSVSFTQNLLFHPLCSQSIRHYSQTLGNVTQN